MFCVGDHYFQNSKVYFITEDKAMIRIAENLNSKFSVLTLEEYQEMLNAK